MKILCCCLNSKFIHSSLSVWYIYSGVKKYCSDEVDIDIYETTINDDMNRIVDEILYQNADIISFSCYIWNITKTLELCRIIKERHNVKIVLGGPEVSYRQKEMMHCYPYIDFILSGDGEWTFPSFVNSISNDGNFDNCEGLTYRYDKEIIVNAEKYHCETPPSPYCEKYFEKLNGRIAYIESSRGCPFSCAYCLSGRKEKVRYFNIEQVENDLIKFSNNKVKTVKFIDRTFNASEKHSCQLLEFILENYEKYFNYGVRFHFEISADILTEKQIALFSKMPKGLMQLEIGIQSLNPLVIKNINRKCDLSKIINNVKLLMSFDNIHIHTDLIAGLPEENYKSFVDGFNVAFELRTHMLQLGFLKILSGTTMFDIKNNFGYVYSNLPPYEVVSNNSISKIELDEIRYCENALNKMYNNGRFLYTVDYLLKSLKKTPFELFNEIGKNIPGDRIGLSEYAETIFLYFSDKCDCESLRECILCDLRSVPVMIKIPDTIKKYSPLYKTTMKYFSEKFGEKVDIVLLDNESKAYVVRRTCDKNLYNRYVGEVYNIDFLK